jgi:hypothetical protein
MKQTKKPLNNNLNYIILASVGVAIIALLLVFIFPLLEGIIGIFIALSKMYLAVDITAKFFGGFLFLFIFWKFLEALAHLLRFLIDSFISYYVKINRLKVGGKRR